MLVDLDDVRDPATGHISDEAARIVDRLDAYAEVSTSGTGLHLFVRAALPGDLGKFIGDLEDIGHIEFYDHGRAVGATWRHVDGTPQTVPERQSVITDLITEYEDASQRKRRLGHGPETDDSDHDSPTVESPTLPGDDDDDGDIPPYFSVDTARLAHTGYFATHGTDTSGPHPGHGPKSSDPDNCTNFALDGDQWYCFLHDSGGVGLSLAAVLCPHTSVDCKAVPKNAASDNWLSQQPTEMLRTCLWLRDECGVADDAEPPTSALEAAAEHVGLHTGRGDGLGSHRDVARTIFDELDAGDI
jgi:hypothetical protein